MATAPNALETYDNLAIREDLQEQYSMISPEEVPFQTAIGVGESSSNTYHEWTIVELDAPDSANRVAEGEDAPAVDAPTVPARVGNFTQISDKVVKVSHTSEAVDSAANDINKISKQVALKLRALKRDMEVMVLSNIAASAGAAVGAGVRVAAGFPAWLRTNTHGEAGGTDPTLSDTTSGYPNAIANVGDVPTPVPLDEDVFNDVIQKCWEEGGNPTIALVNANNKRVISNTFTGSSTRYKDAIDKTLVNAIDIYDSDFGQLSIVPNRFQPALNAAGANDNFAVYLLDPDFAHMSFLETVKNTPLAKTGHTSNRLIWAEYTLQVDNEAAHGVIRDTNGLAA